jgi:hypothetical protein
MINWFPLASKLYTRKDFNNLPITGKVYFLELVSQSNYYKGEFYKSDDYFAIKFGVSTKTIRRHRKKLTEIGLINTKPGQFGKGGQNLATTYLTVSYSNDKDCPAVDDYINFARIHRYSFNTMLQIKEFNLNDVWVWVTLWWWKQNKPTDNNEFFITKKELERLTGYGQAVESIEKIYQTWPFGYDKGKLFQYKEKHHKINFSDWAFFADPTESDNTDTFEPEIQRQLETKRNQEDKKDLKQFLQYFKREYRKLHNKNCNISSYQKTLINNLIEEHGLKTVKDTAKKYFNTDILLEPTGTKRKSLARFTRLIQEGYFNLSD